MKNSISFDGQSLITRNFSPATQSVSTADVSARKLADAEISLALTLKLAHDGFEQGRAVAGVVRDLAGRLHELRARSEPDVWKMIVTAAQRHPVGEYLRQDPFTNWSFEKPRGYSGDAQLLDFIYGHASVAAEIANATDLGRAIYDYTKDASSSVAVRERRDILTRLVDETSAECGGQAEILTIAAGHLREANASTALKERRIQRWVALDQDPLSVGSIARDFAGTPVEAIDGSIRDIFTDRRSLGSFDLAYAAGLYDYLSRSVAVKLTRKCMQLLKPKGTFLFANFASDIGVDGYMETFMDWPLLLRGEAQMWDIINASVDRNMVEAKVYFGENRNIVYGVITKRA